MSNQRISLSYCVPVYNEEKVLIKSLERIDKGLYKILGNRNYEIVVVENGSIDRTKAILASIKNPRIKKIFLVKRGQGRALRAAIRKSTFNLVVTSAISLPFGFSDLKRVLPIWDEYDLIHGSKAHLLSKGRRSLKREVYSRVFRGLLNIIFNLKIKDPQGSKFLKKDKILPFLSYCDDNMGNFITQLTIYGEIFGLKTTEIPVTLKKNVKRNSKFKFIRDVLPMFIWIVKEYIKIRRLGKNKINLFSDDPRCRFGLVLDCIPEDTKSILDYGCSDGFFLSKIRNKFPKTELYGIDVDDKRLAVAQRKIPRARISKILGQVVNIDVVTCLDVLEHVPDEGAAISEIYRVLRKGGHLLLSTPNKGLTQVFDPGNIKFRFPKLHRFLYEKMFHQENYQTKYCGEKLIGDISKQLKPWHKHYSFDDLRQLLEPYFRIKKVYYYGLFFPILSMLDQAYSWIFKKECKILRRLVLRDSRINYGRFSFSIFIHAVKV